MALSGHCSITTGRHTPTTAADHGSSRPGGDPNLRLACNAALGADDRAALVPVGDGALRSGADRDA